MRIPHKNIVNAFTHTCWGSWMAFYYIWPLSHVSGLKRFTVNATDDLLRGARLTRAEAERGSRGRGGVEM